MVSVEGRVIPCGEKPETHQGWRVVYLVVRLDVELDLLAGECSDPVWTRNVSLQLLGWPFPVRGHAMMQWGWGRAGAEKRT